MNKPGLTRGASTTHKPVCAATAIVVLSAPVPRLTASAAADDQGHVASDDPQDQVCN